MQSREWPIVDETVLPALESWVSVPPGSDFPIQNLPLGVIRRRDGAASVAIAIGDHALDVSVVASAGLLEGIPRVHASTVEASSLNGLLACGPSTWRALRARVSELLRADNHELRSDAVLREEALVARDDVAMLLPVEVGDFVDCYASLQHVLNMGRILRPGQDPLPPSWRSVPMAYHGRAGTVVVDGACVARPHGVVRDDDGTVVHRPTRQLDFELEVGCVVGIESRRGHPLSPAEARDAILGLVLVNDWSARDIQAFEYQPLGPFQGKSFATSVSPWVVPLDALGPYFVPNPPQQPPALPHLRCDEPWALDLALEVTLQSARMRETGIAPEVVTRTNFSSIYWTIAQQLAHVTANGASVRPGDLVASGTVSGAEPGSEGSMIERTEASRRPITLPGGEVRGFLEDGDRVVMRGVCERPGRARIGFGEVSGTVVPWSDDAG